MECFACSRVCCQEPDAHRYSVKNEETSVVKKKKNPGGLGCLRIATGHQCLAALTNTQRGLRASSPYQDRGTAFGFHLSSSMLLEAQPGVLTLRQYRELLCPGGKNLLANSS